MKNLIFLALSLIISASAFAKPGDALKYLPVQDGGRIKPYDSFARENARDCLRQIHVQGKRKSSRH